MYVCIYMCVYECMHMCVYARICMHVSVCVVCMCMYMYVGALVGARGQCLGIVPLLLTHGSQRSKADQQLGLEHLQACIDCSC